MKTRLVAAALTLAAIAVAPAAAAPPTVTPATGTEGTAIAVPVSHTCRVKKRCLYDITTVDGTATAGADYTSAQQTGRARKAKTFAVTLSIPTADDAACEANETFTVHVDVTNKKGTFGYDTIQTITDDDCATEPPLPISVIEPPAGTKIDTTRTADGGTQTCTTPLLEGRYDTGTKTWWTAPCYVHVWCPTTVRACEGSGSSTIRTAGALDFVNTSANAIIDDKGTPVGRFTECKGFGTCKTDVAGVYVKPGEAFIVECSGANDPSHAADGVRTTADPTGLICVANLVFSI